MDIIIPFNKNYLRSRYEMSTTFLDRLGSIVIPNLLNRLSMDDRIKSIEVFSDLEPDLLLGISRKICLYPSDTSKLSTAEGVIESCFKRSKIESEISIFYNPLFPFVSVEKIYLGFNFILKGSSSSTIGGFSTQLACQNSNIVEIIDQGIFRILKREDFFANKKKLNFPIDIIGLSAMELISLRSADDLDLFELILNSGYR